MPALSALGERGMLARIYGASRGLPARVLVGPGDDSAVLRCGPRLVLSQDDQVEGTHFLRRWADPRRLAGRLLRVSASDLAAMGDVRPLACTVSAALDPRLPKRWFEGFLRGAQETSRRLRMPLVGGNLARSKHLSFSCCVLGEPGPRGLVLRSGARPGDLLAGVGPHGEAAAGLAALKRGRNSPFIRRFWEPEPMFAAGRALAGLATSLMDNSDGLAASARTLAEASGVSVRVDPDRLRVADGEDYGLVFTVPPRRWAEVRRRLPRAYLLGEVVRGRAVDVGRSFEHFR